MDELPRLRDEDSALGEALRDATDVGPSDADRAKVVAGLGAILGPPPGGLPSASGGEAASGGTAATGGASSAAGSVLIKWAAAACLVGGAVWWGVQEAPATSPVGSAPVVENVAPTLSPVEPPAETNVAVATNTFVEPEAPPVRGLAEEARGPEQVLARTEGTRPRTEARTSAPSAMGSSASRGTSGNNTESTNAGSARSPSEPEEAQADEAATAQTATEQQPSELGLLAEARRVLRRSPSQTLVLTEQHRERFHSGALVEEREVLAIEALVRLSRRSQASARAERFRRLFPHSIHATRISAVLTP